MTFRRVQQEGIFHVTTKSKRNVPWCTLPGIPKVLIDNLCMTRHLYEANLIDFCILPDHLHIILEIGSIGISKFMHSFKRNSARDVKVLLTKSAGQYGISCTGWQHGFHDEYMRTEKQLLATQRYVQENAWNHELVRRPEEWPWSSLHFEHLLRWKTLATHRA